MLLSVVWALLVAGSGMITAARAAPPEQIHLALTELPGCMRVTWATMRKGDGDGRVVFVPAPAGSGGSPRNTSVTGKSYSYAGDSFEGTLHTALLTGLRPNEAYVYRVVSASGQTSTPLTFRYVSPEAQTLALLAYGDMGVKNSAGTVAQVGKEAASGKYDLFLNVGDTSYANDDGPAGRNAYIFDEHFRNLQGHAGRMPFMTVPGNHESQYDFAPYKARLPMPKMANASQKLSSFYWSVDIGPAHVIGYSTEHPVTPGSEQHEFLQRDLAAASAPSARATRPWIIMLTHHPMYCSSLVTWSSRCLREAANFRRDLEPLMVAAHVDILMSGHNHQYERSFAVMGCQKDASTGCHISKATHNAPYPIYIVNGAGGDTEGIEPTWVGDKQAPYRAAHSGGFKTGYGRATLNHTHLVWDYIYSGEAAIPGTNASDPKGAGEVVDTLVLTRGR
jgi:hypothetical protein